MKRIIFSIIAIALLFWLWPEKDKPHTEVGSYSYEQELEYDEEPILKPSPTPVREKKATQQLRKISPQKMQQESQAIKLRKLPPGVVEFELKKGNWAVAHGDILLGKLQSEIQGQRGQYKPKPSVLWESGQIPYAISSELPKDQLLQIIDVMNEISSMTHVNFYQVTNDTLPDDYIVFTASEDICASYLGKIGGQQPIFLKPECGPKEIRHEAMHALGFVHEQSRADRDRYVKINWENIEPGFENQFDIAPEAYLENYRGFVFAFDYKSVMLYSSLHFSKDKLSKTIESVTNKQILPSQEGLSEVDIQRINYLYSD